MAKAQTLPLKNLLLPSVVKDLGRIIVAFVLLSTAVFAQEKTQAPRGPASPTSVLVDDFEDLNLRNLLGGESGAWDTDPEDDSADCFPEVVKIEGLAGSRASLKLTYDVDSSTEDPAQNGYWTKLRNLDASGYDHLEFDVRGDGEKGYTTKFKVEIKKYKDKARIEKLTGGYLVENITSEWQTLRIPLNKMTGIINFADPEVWKNPSISRKDLDEFVIVFQGKRATQKTGAIYLDNIRFVKTDDPGPTAVDFPPRKGMKTPVPLEGVDYAKFLVERLQGYPKTVVVKKKFPRDDREFLMEVARDTWKFFDQIVDREHQLPLDTIQLGRTEPISPEGFVGDYTNVTNIGLYFIALVSAYDLGFIPKEEAIRRLQATLKSLEKMEWHRSGFPYNYYDTTTLERTSYFVSFVDSGWLAAGLYIVKNVFPEELGPFCEKLLSKGNFRFFYDEIEGQMLHGYYEHLGVYSDYHYGVFYTEPRMTSYLAVARGEVPRGHWFRMVRTFPENFVWQTQDPKHRVKKKTLGVEYYDGYYEWKGIRFVPSWGGSVFEALMPTLVLDEKALAPEGLGLNDKRHAQIHLRYGLRELGYPVWGMSPSSRPEGGYSEYGVKVLGAKGYDAGVVTPHASFLALEFVPKAAIANLRKLIQFYDLYGEYGFYDAVDVKTGQVAYKYLALDQAMSFVALNNYLNAGAIRKRFHQDPVLKEQEILLSAEKFFERIPSEES